MTTTNSKPNGRGDPPENISEPKRPEGAEPPKGVGPGGFDLERLRLSQDFGTYTATRRVITQVPLRKPNKQEYVRVHPEWRFETAILDLKTDHEQYFVDGALQADLFDETKQVVIFGAVTRREDFFLWPARLPASDGRRDSWAESALDLAHVAMTNWVRIKANMSSGAYEAQMPVSTDLPGPVWPDMSFEELMQLALRGRLIESVDHPVLRRLRGER